MKELKAYYVPTRSGNSCHCYIKQDVDKVIAEKDKAIAELKAQKAQAEADCAYWKMSEGNAVNAMHETEEYTMQLYNELRHQKFKRCLDKAAWCMTEYIQSKCLDFTNTEQWYWRRWHTRWLELAEKFKEAK